MPTSFSNWKSAVAGFISIPIDLLSIPFTLLGSIWLRAIRRFGIQRLPLNRTIFSAIGVFPILDNYTEPLFRTETLSDPLERERELPGIDLNIKGQLALLEKFHYNDELLEFPLDKVDLLAYAYNYGPFLSGDAEYLYSMIRYFRPKILIEIGSGQSTLMARNAINRNSTEDRTYTCEHICIEPYLAKWLESLPITVIREPVERVDKTLYDRLLRNDILFVDSSHIIRPQGDVLTEYLQILPSLRQGVIIHVHDIFTPRDYLNEWVKGQVLFWNEQYVLEAFLSCNPHFEIIGAVNFLKNNHPAELSAKCPILARQMAFREPGSFWLRRK